MSRAARCATCHVSNDAAAWNGPGLNLYGQRLGELAPDDALADRMAAMERGPSASDSGDERKRKQQDQDIDGDGVPNWIEVLALANPGDAKDVPKQNRIERVRRVVSCNICHDQTNLPGKQGLDANPHNAFGELLSETTTEKKAKPDTSVEDRRRMAERIPILTRIASIKRKKPKGSKATYWEKLRLMRLPADKEDNPSPEGLKKFRKRAASQRSARKRDPTRGMVDPAHNNEGFLQDAEKLD